MLEADEEARIEGHAAPSDSAGFGPGPALDEALPAAVSGRRMAGVAMVAEDWRGSHGLDLPTDRTARRQALHAFGVSMSKARSGRRLRDAGQVVDNPPRVALPASLVGPDVSALPSAGMPAAAWRQVQVEMGRKFGHRPEPGEVRRRPARGARSAPRRSARR